MATPLIYIAGPYTSPDGHDYHGYHGIERNIANAREVAAWLANLGVHFFCPHLHSAHFEVITPEVPPEYWYELDLRVLRHCDALLLIWGWEKSKGSLKERVIAETLGIPVFKIESIWGAPLPDAARPFHEFLANFGGAA